MTEITEYMDICESLSRNLRLAEGDLRELHKVALARLTKISALEEALHQFMEFQITDYDRMAGMAKRYCEIRRHARNVLAGKIQ